MKDIYTLREEKDILFASEHSPLGPEKRANFSGLEYFRVQQAYRVKAEIVPFAPARMITLTSSSGAVSHFWRYGWAKFELQSKKECLTLYVPSESVDKTSFFIPFSDESNGKQTYGGGRYLDVSLDANSELWLDFNLAYNPYCAYDYRWSCVLPPQENHVEQPVLAGERVYPE